MSCACCTDCAEQLLELSADTPPPSPSPTHTLRCLDDKCTWTRREEGEKGGRLLTLLPGSQGSMVTVVVSVAIVVAEAVEEELAKRGHEQATPSLLPQKQLGWRSGSCA